MKPHTLVHAGQPDRFGALRLCAVVLVGLTVLGCDGNDGVTDASTCLDRIEFTGNYTRDDVTAFAFGSEREGRLEPSDYTITSGHHFDFLVFESSVDGAVRLDVQSDAFTPVIGLYDEESTPLAQGIGVDGQDHHQRIEHDLAEGVCYVLWVTNYDADAAGDYLVGIGAN